MKKREIAGIICLALLSVVPSHDALAYSYAEVMAGLAAPTGLEVHHSNDADRVTPGPVATTLVLQGLFPVSDPVYFSPSFSYLSTGGNVEGDPVPPARMISAIPAWIMAIPEMAASMPEMQTRLTVTAVTVSGIPASSAPTRVTFRVSADSMQQP